MPEAVCDTGPALHLEEVGRLTALSLVAPLLLPDLVLKELETRGLGAARLREVGIAFTVRGVEPLVWRKVARDVEPRIQPADAQVFSLAQASGFRSLVLTDDLALRRLLEKHGNPVTGTVGVLIRAYTARSISRDEMETAFEALFEKSTLHLGPAFRVYVRKLLADLP
ncbi:MAG: hypothetical protein ACJ76Y_19910 [Thermoanaerobaculia bacterium]